MQTSVLTNTNLLGLITQFQDGLYQELLPWYKEAKNIKSLHHPSFQGLMYVNLPERFLSMPYTSDHVIYLPMYIMLPARHLNLNSSVNDPRLTLHIAIVDGDIYRIERLLKCYPTMASSQAMDLAAQCGYLHVVQFLHKQYDMGCTTNAMDYAAGNGHIEIVQFLAEHRKEGCTENAMYDAAMYGHLNVVQYLYNKGLADCTSIALMHAQWHQHYAVASFIESHCSQGQISVATILNVSYPFLLVMPKSINDEFKSNDDDDVQCNSSCGQTSDSDEDCAPPPSGPRLTARRNTVMATPLEVEKGWMPPKHPKSATDKSDIRKALKNNILFDHLDDTARNTIVDAMQYVNFERGDTIIHHGTEGDVFYILAEGSVDILIKNEIVATSAANTRNNHFGELALLYDAPRSATVVAATDVSAWALDRLRI
ncbi:Bcy1 protein kinase A regulatory subunit, partial [Thraustotheca clavata]